MSAMTKNQPVEVDPSASDRAFADRVMRAEAQASNRAADRRDERCDRAGRSRR
eukprot:NODE_9061_length_169_cov_0.850000_g8390_i0.p3 GENE.NODE_9061_length_169_cov_0.850000_g8390_i0~~NODE_9061_length_169_cov_0.850000_g8390_i0.p3  ORF type:complete len:53 (-),score=5.99 NODE_9061_length_169_cov_0.850000_g8390_i0:11-169(-)